MGAFPSFFIDPSTHPCIHLATLPSSLSSFLPLILLSIHPSLLSVLPSIHPPIYPSVHPSISSVKMSFHPSIHHPCLLLSFLPFLLPAIIPPLYSSHAPSSCSIKGSFPHLWNGIITTLLCFNNSLKYCTQVPGKTQVLNKVYLLPWSHQLLPISAVGHLPAHPP